MSRAIKIGEATVGGVNFDRMECYVGDDPEKGVKGERVEYNLPKTAADFSKLVSTATGEALTGIWERYNYGHGLKARAAGRPDGGGVTLPVISTKKYGKLNLVTGEYEGGAVPKGAPVPLENRVRMINAGILAAQAVENPIPRALNAAREQLLAAKLVVDDKGALKVAGK